MGYNFNLFSKKKMIIEKLNYFVNTISLELNLFLNELFIKHLLLQKRQCILRGDLQELVMSIFHLSV